MKAQVKLTRSKNQDDNNRDQLTFTLPKKKAEITVVKSLNLMTEAEKEEMYCKDLNLDKN